MTPFAESVVFQNAHLNLHKAIMSSWEDAVGIKELMNKWMNEWIECHVHLLKWLTIGGLLVVFSWLYDDYLLCIYVCVAYSTGEHTDVG